jgi:hypothetical protein
MTDRKSARVQHSVSGSLATIASFAGAFFLIEQSLATVGVPLTEANQTAFVAGLSIAGPVDVALKLRASRRSWGRRHQWHSVHF